MRSTTVKALSSVMLRLPRDPLSVVFYSLQDQLSADMYSFVAKEIDYANYFQMVSFQKGEAA